MFICLHYMMYMIAYGNLKTMSELSGIKSVSLHCESKYNINLKWISGAPVTLWTLMAVVVLSRCTYVYCPNVMVQADTNFLPLSSINLKGKHYIVQVDQPKGIIKTHASVSVSISLFI